MSKGKVLVTGATGHIGPYVVKHLLEKGYYVRIFVLPQEKDSLPGLEDLKRDVEVSTGDVRCIDDLIYAFSGADAGIHIAAKIGIYGHKREIQQMQEINHDGTINFHEAAKRQGIDNIVTFGSIEALKDPKNWRPGYVPEQVFGALSQYTSYGKIKADTLKEVLISYPFTKIVLPPGVIGPNDHVPSEIGKEIRKAMYDRLPSFAIKGNFMWAHPDDVAYAATLVLENGKHGEYYFVDGFEAGFPEILLEVKKNIRNDSFAKRHVSSYVITIPHWMAWNIAQINYKISNILNRPTAIRLTPVSVSVLTKYNGVSNALVRKSRELGYAPQHCLEDTLAETVEYFQKQK